MSQKQKLDQIINAFETLSDESFEKWLENQPSEYGLLFYQLIFPPSSKSVNSQNKKRERSRSRTSTKKF